MSSLQNQPSEVRSTPGDVPAAARRKGTTAIFNFWIDVALACAVSSLLWISAMLQVVFPPPTRTEGWTLWGWNYDQWHNAQFAALCVCGLLAVEHVVLHWTWVCGVITTKILRLKSRPDDAVQMIYGIGFFFLLMSVAFAATVAATFAVRRPMP